MMQPELIEAVAASLTAVAACAAFAISVVALRATYDAPRKAAEFAENLRAQSQAAEERRRLRLWVFSTLMQHRAQLGSTNSVSALNLIDVVFFDEIEVRQAWRSFMASTAEIPFQPAKTTERYLTIIEKMSRALGLNQNISVQDIQLVYFPRLLGELAEADQLEVQERLKRLKGGATLSNDQAEPIPPLGGLPPLGPKP